MDTYELIRSRRKTLALELTREGRLIVRAPLRISRREISYTLVFSGKMRNHFQLLTR